MSARVKLKFESWERFWSTGGRELIQAEYDEHKVSNGLWKEHDPDYSAFDYLSKSDRLLVAVARLLGKPIGYYMATISTDLESKNSLMAQQGPWYVLSIPTGAKVAMELEKMIFAEIRSRVVIEIELHHPVVGRGARLGKHFARLGARPTNVTYLLRL